MHPRFAVPWLIFGMLGSACIQRPSQQAASGADASAEEQGSESTDSKAAAIAKLPRTPVLGPGGVRDFQVNGQAEKVEVQVIPVSGQPFGEALQAKIKQPSNSEWSVQVQATTTAPVKKGDRLLATFYVRAAEMQASGKAVTEFVFEKASGPYTKSIQYPLFLGPEWRKVQVRFTSREDYAAGEAQMIFRLGYEPEVIEVGGITVENFGQSVKLLHLPSTEVADLKFRPKPVKEKLPEPVDGGELAVDVDPGKVITKISPYVYGINSQKVGGTRTTIRRMGGNRQTAYNWENNASSAGSDWQHLNDDWSCTNLGYKNCNEPAGQFTSFVDENSKDGIESLVVVPIIDWVAADKSGPVPESDAAPSKRYVRSYPKKPGEYTLTPDLRDNAVYQDEFVNFLVQKYGRAAKGGVKFYALDNEPALWPVTHPRVHPKPPTYEEVVKRTEATAVELTRLDPSATVLGGVMFGWSEFMSLSSAPDHEQHNAEYGTYIDYFLASMKELEKKHGRRLVHVLDIHWYPELRGTARVTEDDASRKTIEARLEAPRSFWDPTYKEKSWIGDQWGKPIRLFPWLKEVIAKRYPGTKLALTEYNFGSGKHISGGLAQADVLGILGREGVFMANYWGNGPGVGELPAYIEAAFKLYRNYDGKGGQFGDTAVQAAPADIAKASAFAATDSKGRLTVLVINKDVQNNFKGKIRLGNKRKYASAVPYVLDSSSPEIKALPKVAIQGNVIEHTLPRLSATLFVCDP
ncbi:MAG TPA: glycoside hydrolase family 44 protein [Polyangiaceae bacterium]|nr:glycoside hydrolase family 44 protein [Polyangiaceae bacterium]